MSDIENWLADGKEKFDNQRYFEARDLLQKVIEEDEQHVEALELLALTMIHIGEFEQAKQYYEELLELKDTVDIRLRYAGLLLMLDQPQLARSEFEIVLDREPENLNALKGIGDTYFKENNFLDAQKKYDQVLEQKPDDAYLWYSKAEAYYRAQDHESALEAIENAIDIESQPEFFAFKGDFFIRHDNFERALEQYVLAANLAPDDPEIRLRLGYIYRVLGRKKDALSSFDDALKEDPYMTEALENKVEVLDELGREEQAINALKSLVRLQPQNKNRSMELAQYHLNKGDLKQAQEILESIINYHSEDPELWFSLAVTLYKRENHKQALHAIEKSMEFTSDEQQENQIRTLEQEIQSSME